MWTRFLCALSSLTLAAACGGRSVNLDGPISTSGTGGAASVDLSPKTILNERIYQFWVDDVRLYWYAYLSSVESCLLSDCDDTKISYGTPWAGIAIGRNDVYWIPQDQQTIVASCPSAGCAGAPRTFLHDPNSVAVNDGADGDYFYWSSAFDIYRCPSAGCAATPEVVAAGETADGTFQFQGDYAYWTSSAPDTTSDGGTITRVLRAPKDGSTSAEQILPTKTDELSDQLGPQYGGGANFALDSQNVYWIDSSVHVLSCPLAGCGDSLPTQWVGSGDQKFSLQVDDAGLYWVEPPTGSTDKALLHFCAFAHCSSGDSVVVIDKSVYQYQLNGQFIYWTETPADAGYPQSIQRVAKPTP
jgi:hypothetical protein